MMDIDTTNHAKQFVQVFLYLYAVFLVILVPFNGLYALKWVTSFAVIVALVVVVAIAAITFFARIGWLS